MTEQEQIIATDLSFLKNDKKIGHCFGEFIDSGSYGFVLEYLDDSPEQKVIKVLDPSYVESGFRDSQPRQHSSLLSRGVIRELDLAQKVGYTKSPHLMPLMNSPQKIILEDRTIAFLVMPRLNTIEALDPAPNREQQIVAILRDCCSGLQVLHREPEIVGGRKNGMDALVHCDIKPNNIFYSGEPPCFMLGDYSIAQRVADLEKNPLAVTSDSNPYCPQEPLRPTSDIYSLGWVLFYWMGGKLHPTTEQIRKRAENDLPMPPFWKDNPELWQVFLTMTDPDPARRYPKAEDASAALQTALRERETRLADANVAASYNDGKNTGRTQAAGIAAAAALTYLLVKNAQTSDTVPSNGNGQLHGSLKKKADYMGGKFQGLWENGCPKEGTFISASGKKHTGKWQVQENVQLTCLNCGALSFSGLLLEEKDQLIPHQGKLTVQWPWGSSFACDLDGGSIINGIMTFSNGTQSAGGWETSATGIFREEKDKTLTGILRLSAGPQAVFECETIKNNPIRGCVILRGQVAVRHTDPTYEQAANLLLCMHNTGSHFEGIWDEKGFPQNGRFQFSSGKRWEGTFFYVENRQYPKAHYTGMIGIDGLPWGVGSAKYPDGKTVTGEFMEGTPLKKGRKLSVR